VGPSVFKEAATSNVINPDLFHITLGIAHELWDLKKLQGIRSVVITMATLF